MDKMMIVNASPRAPKSNSKSYANLFLEYHYFETEYFNLSKNNHQELCDKMNEFSNVLLVFPLYADSIPVTLLHFLKALESSPPDKKPTISVIINCGFIEAEQNDVAIQIIKVFCKQNGYPFGSVLKIGSGEAILTTPFRFLVKLKMKRFASSIKEKNYRTLQTTMPLPKKLYLKATTDYWVHYGEKNGISKEQMQTMQIE